MKFTKFTYLSLERGSMWPIHNPFQVCMRVNFGEPSPFLSQVNAVKRLWQTDRQKDGWTDVQADRWTTIWRQFNARCLHTKFGDPRSSSSCVTAVTPFIWWTSESWRPWYWKWVKIWLIYNPKQIFHKRYIHAHFGDPSSSASRVIAVMSFMEFTKLNSVTLSWKWVKQVLVRGTYAPNLVIQLISFLSYRG